MRTGLVAGQFYRRPFRQINRRHLIRNQMRIAIALIHQDRDGQSIVHIS